MTPGRSIGAGEVRVSGGDLLWRKEPLFPNSEIEPTPITSVSSPKRRSSGKNGLTFVRINGLFVDVIMFGRVSHQKFRFDVLRWTLGYTFLKSRSMSQWTSFCPSSSRTPLFVILRIVN